MTARRCDSVLSLFMTVFSGKYTFLILTVLVLGTLILNDKSIRFLSSDAPAGADGRPSSPVGQHDDPANGAKDETDGGGAAAADGASQQQSSGSSPRNVHVHIIAIGDSLMEGVSRVRGTSTKLRTTPIAPMMATLLETERSLVGGESIVSATSQVIGYRGQSSGQVLHQAGNVLFRNPHDREALVPASIPAELSRVLLNGVDSATGTHPVHRVVMVCLVMAGTNDMLRAPGSTFSELPPVTVDKTLRHNVELHRLCADYARAMLHRQIPQDSTMDGSIVLLPSPPLPVMFGSGGSTDGGGGGGLHPVVKALQSSVAHKPGALRFVSYCFADAASQKAMLRFHAELVDRLTSPGQFLESLEALAKELREREGIVDTFGMGGRASGMQTNKRNNNLHVVTVVAKEVLRFDRTVFSSVQLKDWTDCLHPSMEGYQAMGKHAAQHVRQQL